MKKIILYTDGSYLADNGKGGYGAHGYLIDTEVPGPKSSAPPKHVITINGYMSTSSIIKASPPEKLQPLCYYDWNGSFLTTTLELSELEGVSSSLETVVREIEVNEIILYTDSAYVLRGLKAIEKIKDSTEISNSSSWKRIGAIVDLAKEKGITLDFRKVKAHSGDVGNNKADMLASIGTNNAILGIESHTFTESPTTKYWNPTVLKNPYIEYRRMFFNTVKENNIDNEHILLNYKDLEDVGKKLAGITYSIIRTEINDPVIDIIKNTLYNHLKDISIVASIQLDAVFNPMIYNCILERKESALRIKTGPTGTVNLVFANGRLIANTLNPPGLSITAMQTSDYISNILDQGLLAIEGDVNKTNVDLTAINITDKIYDKDTNKLKKEIENNYDIKLENDHMKITLDVSVDTPTRNQFKRMESLNPNVYLLIIKQSENVVSYMTVVKDDNNVGIWSNYYASVVLKK